MIGISSPNYYRDKKSLFLDGVNEYVTITDSNSLSFGNSSTDSAFSISAWINMVDATSFNIFSKQDITNDIREYVFQSDGTDKLKLFLFYDDSSKSIASATTATVTSLENTWAHVVATYSGNSAVSGINLYINGALQAMTTSAAGATSTGRGRYSRNCSIDIRGSRFCSQHVGRPC